MKILQNASKYIIDYDHENDTLYLKIKGTEVDYTVDIDNILFDIHKGQIVGLEFLKASDFLNVLPRFLKSLRYFMIHLDTHLWEDISFSITLKNDKGEHIKVEKNIPASLPIREGIPSGHFKFGSEVDTPYIIGASEAIAQIEEDIPGDSALVKEIIAKKQPLADYLIEKKNTTHAQIVIHKI